MSSGDRVLMSLPRMRMVPLVGRSKPRRWFNKVVLPDPEPPMMTKISPGLTLSDTLRST